MAKTKKTNPLEPQPSERTIEIQDWQARIAVRFEAAREISEILDYAILDTGDESDRTTILRIVAGE